VLYSVGVTPHGAIGAARLGRFILAQAGVPYFATGRVGSNQRENAKTAPASGERCLTPGPQGNLGIGKLARQLGVDRKSFIAG